jgi:hypothetical protein
MNIKQRRMLNLLELKDALKAAVKHGLRDVWRCGIH